MVNHIRTLLLNETQASLGSQGFPYGFPWYVSPSFLSIDVPERLKPFERSLFGDSPDVDSRINVISAIMPIVHAPDLKEFYEFFDTRSTVSDDTAVIDSVRSFFGRIESSESSVGAEFISSLKSSYGLFSKTGNVDIDKFVDRLKLLFDGAFESSIKIGSAVLAYCFQLEAIRTSV